jgi:hypothetical protein
MFDVLAGVELSRIGMSGSGGLVGGLRSGIRGSGDLGYVIVVSIMPFRDAIRQPRYLIEKKQYSGGRMMAPP